MIKTTITILLCTLAFIIGALKQLIESGASLARYGAEKLSTFENYLVRKINERKGILPAAA